MSDLTARLDGQAAELEDVERIETVDGAEYRRGGAAFAEASGGRASFRLKPDVARVVLGMPDVSPSARGTDWVTLEPAEVDRLATDRAEAWFQSAWRLIGESGGGRGRDAAERRR